MADPLDAGPCCCCDGDLELVQWDVTAVRWIDGQRVRKHDARVDRYQCERCRAGGEIIRAIETDRQLRRTGPAVSDSAARALTRVIAREVGGGLPPTADQREPIAVADGGDPQ